MRIVSPFLKSVVYPALSMAGIFHRTSAAGLAVVTYHGVIPPEYESVDASFDGSLVSGEMLCSQVQLLKKHYDLIAPEDLLAWREKGTDLPARAALLTCDDGLLNCLTEMLPILQQEKVKCLFFVTGASAEESRVMLWYEELFLLLLRAHAGPFKISSEGIVIEGDLGPREQRRAVWWNSVKRLSQVDARTRVSFLHDLRIQFGVEAAQSLEDETSASCRRYGLLTPTELRKLVSAGMSIGAHTLSHPILSQLPAELASAEISECRTRLESALRSRVWAFAYPFGDPQSVTPQVLAMAQNSGYDAAFLNFGGGLDTELLPYALPRIHATAEMSLAEFDAHVSGFYARLHRRAGRSPGSVEMMQGAASK